MPRDSHPFYRTMVFHDTSANEYFNAGLMIKTHQEIKLKASGLAVCCYGYFSVSPLDGQAEGIR